AQVCVCRAEDYAQHQPEEQGANRELLHLHRFGNERNMFHERRALTLSLNDFPSTVFPVSRACVAFITTPICFSEVTPVSASASPIAASISSSVAPAGR